MMDNLNFVEILFGAGAQRRHAPRWRPGQMPHGSAWAISGPGVGGPEVFATGLAASR